MNPPPPPHPHNDVINSDFASDCYSEADRWDVILILVGIVGSVANGECAARPSIPT